MSFVAICVVPEKREREKKHLAQFAYTYIFLLIAIFRVANRESAKDGNYV